MLYIGELVQLGKENANDSGQQKPLAGRLPFFHVAKYEKPSNDLTFCKEV